MKIIIVANSPEKSFYKIYKLNPSDYFIGVDGGAMEIIKKSIKPDLAIGDFDSTNNLEDIKKNSYLTKTFSTVKSETDLELALIEVSKIAGANNLYIEIYDAFGGRIDHELVALRLLRKYHEYNISIIDDKGRISIVRKGENIKLKSSDIKYFSILPIGEAEISIKDAMYELNEVSINELDTYTTSNQPLSADIEPKIYIHQGMVYLIIINK